MERISKTEFIKKCKYELEKQGFVMEIYDATARVIAENKDKQINNRTAKRIKDSICPHKNFSVSVCINGRGSSEDMCGIDIHVFVDISDNKIDCFCLRFTNIIRNQKLVDYEKFCELISNRKKCVIEQIESVNYTISHLDDIISQSKKLLVEMKDFYCNIPYCMRDYLLQCDIYESTTSLLGIY